MDCVIDVGANVGGYGTELRTIGYRGLIVSFEPNPETFAVLSAASARDKNWIVFNLALGSQSGEAEFNVMAKSVFSSFLDPSDAHVRSSPTGNRVTSRIKVRVCTADEVLPDLLARYNVICPYLKMDTQGFDLEVFRGANNLRHSLVALQSELSIKPLYDGAPAWRDALAEYEANGFELSAIYAVHPEAHELVDVDCHMIRTPANGIATAPRVA